MSKIGKLPITIKEGTAVTIDGQTVNVSGPRGQAHYVLPKGILVTMDNGQVILDAENKTDKKKRALYGLTRANLANILKGVDTGFEKKLELSGVGYRAQMQGSELVLSLGFSHPVKFTPQEGVAINVSENVITVSGSDKGAVGEAAAKIRAVRPPEPYKGKGIKYAGEYIRRKAGKAAKAVGTTK